MFTTDLSLGKAVVNNYEIKVSGQVVMAKKCRGFVDKTLAICLKVVYRR